MTRRLDHRRAIAAAMVAVALFLIIPSKGEAAQPGMVRVLLGKAAVQNRMDIGVYGSYLVNDAFSFQRGSKLKLEAKNSGLWLYYEGAAVNAGDKIYLKRLAAKEGEENGLRLNDDLNLLEGDLVVTKDGDSLRVVLHIGIENYLMGLVPYEMSDSFPLEALKAQAIAARSYAMRALRKDRDYDLTDDTNDQVYKGYQTEHRMAHRAVKETQGIVLTYQEQIIQAYYTASNGGQTEGAEHAWGSGQQKYLPVREDPYDAENPESPKKRFVVPRDWKADSDALQALELLLKKEIASQLERSGDRATPEEISIDQILDIAVHTPKYAAPSKLMEKMRFRVKVSLSRNAEETDEEILLFSVHEGDEHGVEAAAQNVSFPAVKTAEVDLDIFPDMEQLMDLSINLKENELIGVKPIKDGFEITSGRYGHGVGMSQRGAEWMAGQYGKTYQEILAFYYPGVSESRYRTVPAARPLLGAEFITTPGPIPTATPRPTLVPQNAAPSDGQWEVIVSKIQQNSSLNLRMLPSTSSDILYQLYYGQKLLVLKRTEDGWLQVQADGISGYVMENFVEKLP